MCAAVSVPTALMSQVPPVHSSLGIARLASSTGNAATSSPAKRARKERGPNWNPVEIKSLIEAKRNQFLQELDNKDSRTSMITDATKWQRISAVLKDCGTSPCYRDGNACKTKWHQMSTDYKRIVDFFKRSGTNETAYWDMNAAERKSENLPRSFPQDIFFLIHEWSGSRPAVTPPHGRDTLAADDCNYRSGQTAEEKADEADDINELFMDPLSGAEAFADSEEHSVSTRSPIPIPAKATSSRGQKGPAATGTVTPLPKGTAPIATATPLPKGTIPPGVTTHLLSSNETVEASGRSRPSNTGQRRKSLSGHSLIANATRATGEAMAEQMKQMAKESQELEKSKIEVQTRLFDQQMQYQIERDMRLQENARLANENAKLAIEKQGQVVLCLANLSSALTVGLQQRQPEIYTRPSDTCAGNQKNTEDHLRRAGAASGSCGAADDDSPPKDCSAPPSTD